MFTITDTDAGEYAGYQIVGLDSEEEVEQTRAERLADLDDLLGVVDSSEECECSIRTAGDCETFESCARHGVVGITIPECCYCDESDDCDCFDEVTRKHRAFAEYVEN